MSYSFLNLEPVGCFMSNCNCCFLTYIQVSQETGKVIWYSHLFKSFPHFFVIYTVKGFSLVNEAKGFLELPCFLHDPVNVGKFISGSSASSNPNLLYTRKGIQKKSVFIPIPKKGNAKECSNYHTTALISHASKVMFKILQVRLQKYMNQELQMFKLNLEKAEEPEIKLPTSAGS